MRDTEAAAFGQATSAVATAGEAVQHVPQVAAATSWGPLSRCPCFVRWQASFAALRLQHAISQPFSGTTETMASAKGASNDSTANSAVNRKRRMPLSRQNDNITSLQKCGCGEITENSYAGNRRPAGRGIAWSVPATGRARCPGWTMLRELLPAGRTGLRGWRHRSVAEVRCCPATGIVHTPRGSAWGHPQALCP
jgi:hypothetical protein